MRIFHNRPLALAECLFVVSALLALCLPVSAKKLCLIVLSGLFAIACVVFSLRKRGRKLLLAGLCLCAAFVAFLSSFLFFDVRYAAIQEHNGKACHVEGYVLERLSGTSFSSMLRVRVETINGENADFDALMECGYSSALQSGDAFSARVTPRDFTEEESFDEENFRVSEGCLLIMTCASEADCDRLFIQKNDPRVVLGRLNTRLSYGLCNLIGGESGGLASAFLLGNRSRISADTTLDFRRAGISHLLALSGLHVSILIGFFELLLRRLQVPKVMRVCLILPAAFGYLALTGFAPSTCRAVLMVAVLYLGFFLHAQYDSFTALCSVLCLILLITPYAVLDLSMWLSFLAAGGIIVFSPAVSAFLKGLFGKWPLPKPLLAAIRGLLSALFVGISANLALLLVSALAFGESSLASVPATLVLSLPVTVFMILSAILLFLPFLPLLPQVCAWLGAWIIRAAERFSEPSGVLLPLGDLPSRVVLLLLTLALILLAVLSVKRRGWFFLPLFLCLCTVAASHAVTYLPPEASAICQVLPAGRGELTLYTRAGEAVLVHDTRDNISMSYEIKQLALKARCGEIGDLVLCEYTNYASYFIAKLSGRICVERLHMPAPSTPAEEAISARLAQEAELHGIAVFYDAEAFLRDYKIQNR